MVVDSNSNDTAAAPTLILLDQPLDVGNLSDDIKLTTPAVSLLLTPLFNQFRKKAEAIVPPNAGSLDSRATITKMQQALTVLEGKHELATQLHQGAKDRLKTANEDDEIRHLISTSQDTERMVTRLKQEMVHIQVMIRDEGVRLQKAIVTHEKQVEVNAVRGIMEKASASLGDDTNTDADVIAYWIRVYRESRAWLNEAGTVEENSVSPGVRVENVGQRNRTGQKERPGRKRAGGDPDGEGNKHRKRDKPHSGGDQPTEPPELSNEKGKGREKGSTRTKGDAAAKDVHDAATESESTREWFLNLPDNQRAEMQGTYPRPSDILKTNNPQKRAATL